jgi:hypothetical protein
MLVFDAPIKSIFISGNINNNSVILANFTQNIDTFTREDDVIFSNQYTTWFDFAISNDDAYLATIFRDSVGKLFIYKGYGDNVFVQLPFSSSGDNFTSNFGGYGYDHGISFLQNGDYLIATLRNVFPNIQVYKRDNDDFTKLTIISDIPENADFCNTISCSPNSNYVAVLWGGFNNATLFPNATIYKRTGDVFTRLVEIDPPDPSFFEWPYNAGFSNDYFVLINEYRLMLYKIENDVFTRVDTVVFDLDTEQGKDVAISRNGKHIIAITRKYVQIYKIENDTMTLVYQNDEAFWFDQYNHCTVSPDSNYFAYTNDDNATVVIVKKIDDDTFLELTSLSTGSYWPNRSRFTNTGY